MRLTTAIRDALALEVLRHRFSDEIEKHVANRAAFAADVYDDIYRKADREKMEALPEGWLPVGMALSAQFGESSSHYEDVSFSGTVFGKLSKLRKVDDKRVDIINRRIAAKHRHNCAKRYENEHRLSARYLVLKNVGKDLYTRVEAATGQVNAALNSVTTLEALLKAWPEIEPFTKRFSVSPPQLPALPVSKLNEMFKLPVKRAATQPTAARH